ASAAELSRLVERQPRAAPALLPAEPEVLRQLAPPRVEGPWRDAVEAAVATAQGDPAVFARLDALPDLPLREPENRLLELAEQVRPFQRGGERLEQAVSRARFWFASSNDEELCAALRTFVPLGGGAAFRSRPPERLLTLTARLLAADPDSGASALEHGQRVAATLTELAESRFGVRPTAVELQVLDTGAAIAAFEQQA